MCPQQCRDSILSALHMSQSWFFENPVHFHRTFTIPSRFYHKKLWIFQFILDSRSSCLWEAVLFLLRNLILSLHFCPKQSKMLATFASRVKQHCRCHTEALQSLGFTAAYLIPLFSLGWASRYRADFNPPWKIAFKNVIGFQWFSTCPSLSFGFESTSQKISAKKASDLHRQSFRFNTSILQTWCARHPWTRSVVTMGRFSCADATSHSDATSRHPKSWRIAWHQNLWPKVKVEMANHKIPTKLGGFAKCLLEMQIFDVKIHTVLVHIRAAKL